MDSFSFSHDGYWFFVRLSNDKGHTSFLSYEKIAVEAKESIRYIFFSLYKKRVVIVKVRKKKEKKKIA